MAIRSTQRGGGNPAAKSARETLAVLGEQPSVSDATEEFAVDIAAHTTKRAKHSRKGKIAERVQKVYHGEDFNPEDPTSEDLQKVRGPGLESEAAVTDQKDIVRAGTAVRQAMESAPGMGFGFFGHSPRKRAPVDPMNPRALWGGMPPTRTGTGTPLSEEGSPYPNRATALSTSVDLGMVPEPLRKPARQFHFAQAVASREVGDQPGQTTPLRKQIAESNLPRLRKTLAPSPARTTPVSKVVLTSKQEEVASSERLRARKEAAQPTKNSRQRRNERRSSSGLKPQ